MFLLWDRPIRNLHVQLKAKQTGTGSGDQQTKGKNNCLLQYDMLSAFSMSSTAPGQDKHAPLSSIAGDLPELPVEERKRIRQKGAHHMEPPLLKKPCRGEPQSANVSGDTGETGVGKSTPGVCTADTGTCIADGGATQPPRKEPTEVASARAQALQDMVRLFRD